MNGSKKQWIKPFIVTVLATLAIQAQATATTGTFPIDGVSDPPCLGEQLLLSGAFFVMNNSEVSNNFITATSLTSARGITGTGLTTGIIYRGVGVWETFHVKTTLTGVQLIVTNTQNFSFISQGQGVKLMLHADTHLTISPDGTVTTSFDKIRLDCK